MGKQRATPLMMEKVKPILRILMFKRNAVTGTNLLFISQMYEWEKAGYVLTVKQVQYVWTIWEFVNTKKKTKIITEEEKKASEERKKRGIIKRTQSNYLNRKYKEQNTEQFDNALS